MKPSVISSLEKLFGTALHPAPARGDDLLSGLMACKKTKGKPQPKYALDGEGHLVGLNLAEAGLTDETWREILALEGFEPGRLRALNLSGNKLTASPLTEWMKALERLDVSENQIKEFALPPGFDALAELNLDENPLEFPSAEILKQGAAAVLRFLKESAAQGVSEVYEVKMLIVGEGGAGKTTLWNKLQDPDYPVPLPEDLQPSTVGIGIKEGWDFEHLDKSGATFLVNLWDFGGQAIQYMTHQFFLTRRSFYVLLADGRRDAANFPYWFKIINLLGCEPNQPKPLPVLVLLNERANQAFKMPYDPETAKTDFPQLDILERRVNFAQKDDRLESLPRAIQAILCRKLSHLPLKIPAYWNAVRRELYALRDEKNYIDFKEFKAICVKNGIAETDERQMTDLSQLLHDLGVILHFQELSLKDFIVLNPEWAVNAVYEVLRHKEVEENQGRFDKEMLQRVWTACQFTTFEQSHLLNLMLKDGLEVCFKARENNREIYIAPQLLPESRPEKLPWPPQGAILRYAFQYPFMPKGIVGRLIVRLHEHLETRDGKKLVWEKGMVLDKKDGCRTLVEETEDVKTGLKLIRIEVSGSTPEERRYALRDITQALDGIHRDSFANLKFEQKIPCCCTRCIESDDPHFFDLSVLKGKKKPTIECPKSEEDVKVQDLFDGVFPDGFKIRSEIEPDDLIEKLVTEGYLREALEKLKEKVPERMKQEVVLLQGRLSDLERGVLLNIADGPEAERQRIRKSILDLNDKAKSQA